MLLKVFITLFTLMSSLEVLAQVDCSKLSQSYGNQDFDLDKTIKSECYQQAVDFISNASHQFAVSVDQSLRVIAYKRILFVTRFEKNKELQTGVIAGSMARLDLIKSVAISDDNKHIAILNQKLDGTKSILLFNADIHGNISPKRVNSDTRLIDSQFIFFKDKKHIAVSMNDVSNEAFILSYSIQSDSRSLLSKMKPQASVVISENNDSVLLDSLISDNFLYILKANGKISQYDATKSLVNEFFINKSFQGKRLFYDKQSQSLLIMNHKNDYQSISLNSL